MRLHITNGDCAVTALRRAGIPGHFLPWRDVLHEGPVPSGLTLRRLSCVRARYIAACGWAGRESVERDFSRRDRLLAGFRTYQEVVLWFEHDLYDQLQLLQVLDWFSYHRAGTGRLSLVQADNYLGPAAPAPLRRLFDRRQPVTDRQLALARRAWKAFRAGTPVDWARLLAADTRALPHVDAAVRRLLEEYPDADGLARSERQILKALAAAPLSRRALFAATQCMEESVFMGDTVFWQRLARLNAGPLPLLEGTDSVRLTDAGRDLLTGTLSSWPGVADRWLGGVHLTSGRAWGWDARRTRLLCAAAS